jgi:hypothetical protein
LTSHNLGDWTRISGILVTLFFGTLALNNTENWDAVYELVVYPMVDVALIVAFLGFDGILRASPPD